MTDYWKNEATREQLVEALEKMQKEVNALSEELRYAREAVINNERLVHDEQLKNIAYRHQGEVDALKWFIRFYFGEQVQSGTPKRDWWDLSLATNACEARKLKEGQVEDK